MLGSPFKLKLEVVLFCADRTTKHQHMDVISIFENVINMMLRDTSQCTAHKIWAEAVKCKSRCVETTIIYKISETNCSFYVM